MKGELKKLAVRLNVEKEVEFKGAVSDDELVDYYSKAFIFVSASEYEGFGISAIEAMAAGTICVLNNIRSFQTFLNKKEFGIIANFNNIEETVERFKELLTIDISLYKKLSIKARDYSLQFSWEKVTNRYYEIYDRLYE